MVSVKKLSEELGITVRQVRTAIDKLVMTNEMTNSKFAECNVFTLINYDKYQSVTNEKANGGQTSDKRLTNRGQTSDKSRATTKEYKEREEYKEYKEIKKEEKKKQLFESPFNKIENEKLKQVLSDFKDMRKVMKKPMTEKAEQLLLNKLDNLSTDTEQQIKIIEQSIERNWLSVFPLKQNNNENKKIPTDEEYSAGLIEGVDYLSG